MTKTKPNSLLNNTDPATWWLYIVQTRYDHWYIGVSNNVAKRFVAHQNGTGAKNLKGKKPLTLIFAMPVGTRSEACSLEWRVKRLSKVKKQQWVATQSNQIHKVDVITVKS